MSEQNATDIKICHAVLTWSEDARKGCVRVLQAAQSLPGLALYGPGNCCGGRPGSGVGEEVSDPAESTPAANPSAMIELLLATPSNLRENGRSRPLSVIAN